jgi:hypothetical protein
MKKFWVTNLVLPVVVSLIAWYIISHLKGCESKEPHTVGTMIKVFAYKEVAEDQAKSREIIDHLRSDATFNKHIPQNPIAPSEPLNIDTIYCTPSSAKAVPAVIASLQNAGVITVNAIHPSELYADQNIIQITHNNHTPRDNKPITDEELKNVQALCTLTKDK